MGILSSCCNKNNDPVFRLNPRESEKIASSLLPSIPAFQFVNETNNSSNDETDSSHYSGEDLKDVGEEELPKLL